MPVDGPHTPANGDEAGAVAGRPELLCLLRLHEIALANPPPVDGLRAMVDEIVRLPSTFRAVVAVPDAGKVGCATSRMSACQTSSRTSRWFAKRHRWSSRP